MLSTDKPITSSRDDVLGFDAFATALAKAIIGQSLNSGLVISVNGAWGSGKTSAVNLALKELSRLEKDTDRDRKTVVVHFDPWLFTGQHNLVAEFFSVLDSQVKKALGEKVSNAIGGVKDFVVQGVKPIMDGAALVAAATGQLHVRAAAKTLTMLRPESKTETKTLTQRLSKLREALEKQKRRIAIVIDDIDRLYPDEMRLILSMLKSVADLPNVVYILPLDIRLVREAVDKQVGVSGNASYLEKIIQVNLDLPIPSRDGLDKLFSAVIAEISKGAEMEAIDFETVGYCVFNAYIKSPRVIYQLANALRVSWSALKDDAYFPDLLAIEAIRLFEPAVYEFARHNKDKLMTRRSVADNPREMVEIVLGLMTHKDDSSATMLLRHLFPIFGFSRLVLRESRSVPRRRLREPEGYDFYFRWSHNRNIATQAELDEFQSLMSSDGNMSEILMRLGNRCSFIGVKASSSLLTAIADKKFKLPWKSSHTIAQLLKHYDCLVENQKPQSSSISPKSELFKALGVCRASRQPGQNV